MDGRLGESTSDISPELVHRADARLRALLGSQMHDLQISVHEDGLVLHGCVSTYYAKQLAQHIAMEILNFSIVTNHIEVR
jgi:osmotically-inducible protein OsmY